MSHAHDYAQGHAPEIVPPKHLSGTDEESRLLDRAIRAANCGGSQTVADAIGLCRTRVRQFRSGVASLSLRHLLMLRTSMPRLFCAIVEELAALVPDARSSNLDPAHHLALLTKELGTVAAEVSAALADGRITDEERTRIRRQLTGLLQATRRALADAR